MRHGQSLLGRTGADGALRLFDKLNGSELARKLHG